MLTFGISAIVVLTLIAAMIFSAVRMYSIQDFFLRWAWVPTALFGLAFVLRKEMATHLGYFSIVPIIVMGILSAGFVAFGLGLILRARRRGESKQSLALMTAFASLPAIVLLCSMGMGLLRTLRQG